jgi:hypothetical protein
MVRTAAKRTRSVCCSGRDEQREREMVDRLDVGAAGNADVGASSAGGGSTD